MISFKWMAAMGDKLIERGLMWLSQQTHTWTALQQTITGVSWDDIFNFQHKNCNYLVTSGMPIYFMGKYWLPDNHIRIIYSPLGSNYFDSPFGWRKKRRLFFSVKTSRLITAQSSNAQWHAVPNQLIRLRAAHGVIAWVFNLLANKRIYRRGYKINAIYGTTNRNISNIFFTIYLRSTRVEMVFRFFYSVKWLFQSNNLP